MRKLYTLLAFFLVIAITFNSCKKEKAPPAENPTIKLAPNTYIIDDPTSLVITQVDSNKLIFTGNTSQLENFKVGDIIVSGIAPNAPYGFLRKILAIQKNGNQYAFSTQEVPMTDAFEELHVHLSKSISIHDTVSGKKESLEFTVNLPNVIVYDADGNNSTTADQIKLAGSISFTPAINADIDIGSFALHYAKISANFETEIQTQITAGGSLASFSKEITVYAQPIGAVPIAGTPIVIVPFLRVNIGANGSINVQISASYTNTSSIGAYIEYTNGAWTNGYNKSMQTTHSFSGIHGNADAKTYVEPGIDFSFWGSRWATGSIVAQGYAKFHGQVLPSVECDLKAGISAGAEANVRIFGWNFASVSYPDIFDYSTTLYTCSGNAQAPVADFSAYQTSINIGQSLSFTDLSTNIPTSWLWSFQGGNPTSSIQQNPTGIIYNNAGTYNVTLTATNATGNDTKTKNAYITVTQPANSCGGTTTVTDVDGNVYNVVAIGNQCWMKENLKTTLYRDGSAIGEVEVSATWPNLQTPAWCYYNGDGANNATYGKLYNWHAVADPHNVCPVGWHVPSDVEFTQLTDYLGGETVARGKLESPNLWNSSNPEADNSSGFTALPAGFIFVGGFYSMGDWGAFWCSSEDSTTTAWNRQLTYWNSPNFRGPSEKTNGLSIRCLKD